MTNSKYIIEIGALSATNFKLDGVSHRLGGIRMSEFLVAFNGRYSYITQS